MLPWRKRAARFTVDDEQFEIVDLPGIYSLEQDYLGLDEKIAKEFLEEGEIDLVINIVDASNLQRNLILTQQLLETSLPMIVVLNMLDVAEQQGVEVDHQGLSEKLGVPIAPMVASRGTGLDHLYELVTGRVMRISAQNKNIDLEESTGDKLVKRYHRSEQLTDGVVLLTPVEHTLTERIDAWAINRWLGVPVFLFMMYLMFTIAISLGAVFIDFFDILFGALFVDTSRYFVAVS